MANGPHRITNGPFDPELYKSEHEVQDAELKVRLWIHLTYVELVTQKLAALNILFTLYWNISPLPQTLLQSSASRKTQKKKKKKVKYWEWSTALKLDFDPPFISLSFVSHIWFNVTTIYWSVPPFSLLQASKTAENATGQPTEDTEAVE